MRAYATNILPTEAAYYILYNSRIVGDQIEMAPGGTATITLNPTYIATLTEYFRINAFLAPVSDPYTGQVSITVKAKTISGKYFTHFCNLTSQDGSTYTAEIELIAENYESLQVIISSTVSCTIYSWELCPQLSNNDIQVIIDGVQQSLPRLLYDYNTNDLVVEEQEQIIGMIACYLLGNTDLQGHFTMNCVASERCTVHIRFLDNNMVELFSPLLFTINAGLTTIGIPHAYLKKLAGIHNFVVTAQVTNGSLNIPIRGVLYTIDGGYLAERLMKPGMDVMDITIQQLSTDSSPSYIWAVGIDNNNVIVKKRTYDLSKYNEAWEAIYTLGEGTLAAIEFDGDWVRRQGEDHYTLETYDVPCIATVDTDGVLKAYLRGTTLEPTIIDTDVTCISLVRGYKSALYPEQDQGLILAYVKGGNVYYKQYTYFDGGYIWITTEQLTTSGDITFAQVHRLNDYRIGIVTQGATTNMWYISERTYVNQAVEPITVGAYIDGPLCFAPLTLEENAAWNTDAIQNDLSEITEPPSIFTLTYPMAGSLSFAQEDDFTNWSSSISVSVRGEDTEEFTPSIVGNQIRIELVTPSWGEVIVSWTNPNLCIMLSGNRRVLTKINSYTWFTSMRTNQSESFNATLTGTLTFEQIRINEITNVALETIGSAITGTLTFEQKASPRTISNQEESVNTALSGTLMFEEIQTGLDPI